MTHSAAPAFAPLRPVARAAVAYLAGAGLGIGLLLQWLGPVPGLLELLGCAAPALLALWLARTSQRDRQQYQARLMAAALGLPLLLSFWLLSDHGWAMLVLLVLHAAIFVAAVVWLAEAGTRIDAAPGSQPLPAPALLRRLQQLAGADTFAISPGDRPGAWVLDLPLPDAEHRAQRLLFDLDAAHATVWVRERVSADGAAPQDADEASMRALSDPLLDAARPQAQRVWLRIAQAAIVQPDDLAAVVLQADGATVRLLSLPPPGPDTARLLLCALVLHSGWGWRPTLWRRPAA